MISTCSNINNVNVNTSGYDVIKKDREGKRDLEVELYREDKITLV